MKILTTTKLCLIWKKRSYNLALYSNYFLQHKKRQNNKVWIIVKLQIEAVNLKNKQKRSFKNALMKNGL